jgi:hypothetical protein
LGSGVPMSSALRWRMRRWLPVMAKSRYLDARHGDGGMVDMTVLDYAMMIEDSHVDTHLVVYRERGPDSAIHGRG